MNRKLLFIAAMVRGPHWQRHAISLAAQWILSLASYPGVKKLAAKCEGY